MNESAYNANQATGNSQGDLTAREYLEEGAGRQRITQPPLSEGYRDGTIGAFRINKERVLNEVQLCYSEILCAARELGKQDFDTRFTKLFDAVYGAENAFKYLALVSADLAQPSAGSVSVPREPSEETGWVICAICPTTCLFHRHAL